MIWFYTLLLFFQNNSSYEYQVKINRPVITSSSIVIVFPNSDRINLPVLNHIIPVIYIQKNSDKIKSLLLDYDDNDCLIHTNQSEVKYANQKISIQESEVKSHDSFLETFSSITREIKKIQTLNNTVVFIKGFNDLEKKIEELKIMVTQMYSEIEKVKKDTDNLKRNSDVIKIMSEKNQSKEEIKAMISEIKNELVTLQKKLNQTKEKKIDIINPTLPIVDQEVVPSNK